MLPLFSVSKHLNSPCYRVMNCQEFNEMVWLDFIGDGEKEALIDSDTCKM